MTLLDVTGNEISALNDADLRNLIARLCAAELGRLRLPISSVTAGGAQDATDGGIDVRVALAGSPPESSFISRGTTGFQVKASEMQPGDITQEMRPHGALRESIRALADAKGAYIIVSSRDSTTDTALERRRSAMRKAVAELGGECDLLLDFFDRERIAALVRQHPSVLIWVREIVGKPLSGWQPYRSWSSPRESVAYLTDDQKRFVDEKKSRTELISIEDGINRLRDALRPAGAATRLVGLSGLGKTRLVEALFDPAVGDNPLDPGMVVYGDLADDLNPTPLEMAAQLGAVGQPACLIVDNCLSGVHAQLSKVCAASKSDLRLLTVEFDVEEDDHEGTAAFRLEPASGSIIEQLVARRHPHISAVDRRRIAELVGGNARMALAIARTIGADESIATFRDGELFDRLFRQRKDPSEVLLKAARICSLLYSFDVESLEGTLAELPRLADLAGMSPNELYDHVAELRARDLVQKRGRWRAVLPPALANHLAKQALARIPLATFHQFCGALPPRMLKSVSRRIGLLHDCDEARQVVMSWLASDGFLARPELLSSEGLEIFLNVAPAAEESVLASLERAVSGEHGVSFASAGFPRWRAVSLVRALAYDARLFRRAVMVLSKFAIAETPGERDARAREAFRELFWIVLSGTRASATERIAVADVLLLSTDVRLRELGFSALGAMLEAGRFSSNQSFEFGARSRDYGWRPKSRDEAVGWYTTALDRATDLASGSDTSASTGRGLICVAFSALWLEDVLRDKLESLMLQFGATRFWPDGLKAVRSTLTRAKRQKCPPEEITRLRSLAATLGPREAVQDALLHLRSEPWSSLDDPDGDDADAKAHSMAVDATNRRTEELGAVMVETRSALSMILPELVRGKLGRGFVFGRGMAIGSRENLIVTWEGLRNAFVATSTEQRTPEVLIGFVSRVREQDQQAAEVLLDAICDDPVMTRWLVGFQCAAPLDEAGIDRLRRALRSGRVPVTAFRQLVVGRVIEDVPTKVLAALVQEVAAMAGGYEPAVDILAMRVHLAKEKSRNLDEALRECARTLVGKCTFEHPKNSLDYNLSELIRTCLSKSDSHVLMAVSCALRTAIATYRAYATEYNLTADAIFVIAQALRF